MGRMGAFGVFGLVLALAAAREAAASPGPGTAPPATAGRSALLLTPASAPPPAGTLAARRPPAPAPRSRCCRRCNRYEFAFPIWVPGVTGTLAAGTQEADVGGGNLGDALLESVDVTTELEFAFVGRFEATIGRWYGFVDGYGADIGNALDFENVGTDDDLDVNVTALFARLGVGWEVGRWATSGCSCLTFAPYLGTRYSHVGVEVGDADADGEWWDVLVGFVARWEISPRFAVRLQADVGFGAEEIERTSWSASIEAHWRLGRHFGLFLGYGLLDQNYAEGSLASRLVYDLRLYGPTLGFTIPL
jgi:hypothetical protein